MFSLTFDGVDPTLFNFVSDAIAVATRWVLGLALSYLYALIVTWQLKTGKPFPVSALGDIPGDFFGAARLARALSWSSPALVFAFLFLAADFSQTVADLGLEFVTVPMEGPHDTVLDLTKRNKLRLIQVCFYCCCCQFVTLLRQCVSADVLTFSLTQNLHLTNTRPPATQTPSGRSIFLRLPSEGILCELGWSPIWCRLFLMLPS